MKAKELKAARTRKAAIAASSVQADIDRSVQETSMIMAFKTPQPPTDVHGDDSPLNIVENLSLIHAIISAGMSEQSYRDLLDPTGWLDDVTMFTYLRISHSRPTRRPLW
uniref:DDE_Tnp_1_7 domain-containing protein n=1 Tax=Ascaris lumbricoides TaxID=6252 RepID=A0A0M3IED9_ASCLU